jgi:2-iminobutanoate/2-iminopropanoate deaminase
MKKYILYFFLVFLAGFLLMVWGDIQNPEDSEIIRRTVQTENAPEAVGPYSQAVQVGETLYLAGQVGIDPASGELVSDSLHLQVWQAMDNLEAVLETAGLTMADVVDVQVFMTDINQYSKFNELYSSYFDDQPPARAVVEVARLPLDAKVEIKMTAVKSSRERGNAQNSMLDQ